MNYWEFANSSPLTCIIVTWILLWGLWPIAWALICVGSVIVNTPFRAYNRHLRHRSIRQHGWPTANLMDADGDIVHPKIEERK